MSKYRRPLQVPPECNTSTYFNKLIGKRIVDYRITNNVRFGKILGCTSVYRDNGNLSVPDKIQYKVEYTVVDDEGKETTEIHQTYYTFWVVHNLIKRGFSNEEWPSEFPPKYIPLSMSSGCSYQIISDEDEQRTA